MTNSINFKRKRHFWISKCWVLDRIMNYVENIPKMSGRDTNTSEILLYLSLCFSSRSRTLFVSIFHAVYLTVDIIYYVLYIIYLSFHLTYTLFAIMAYFVAFLHHAYHNYKFIWMTFLYFIGFKLVMDYDDIKAGG